MNKNLPFVFLPTNKYSRLIYLEGIKEYLVLVNDKLDIFEQGESYAFAYVLGDIKPDEVGAWAYIANIIWAVKVFPIEQTKN